MERPEDSLVLGLVGAFSEWTRSGEVEAGMLTVTWHQPRWSVGPRGLSRRPEELPAIWAVGPCHIADGH
jgi:hypothetical protein